jgi:hypothetical protein
MRKIQHYKLIREQWLPDEDEPKIEAQEIKKDLGKTPSLITSILISLIIIEFMIGGFLFLN